MNNNNNNNSSSSSSSSSVINLNTITINNGSSTSNSKSKGMLFNALSLKNMLVGNNNNKRNDKNKTKTNSNSNNNNNNNSSINDDLITSILKEETGMSLKRRRIKKTKIPKKRITVYDDDNNKRSKKMNTYDLARAMRCAMNNIHVFATGLGAERDDVAYLDHQYKNLENILKYYKNKIR